MQDVDLSRTLNEVSEEIERAAFGLSSWSDVGVRLTEGFPGSACAILSEDPVRQELRHYDAVNIEQHHMDAYAQHFAFRNPWLRVWSYLPDGACAVSERDFPVRRIINTEFYNDFVRHVPNFEASTGLSIDIDPFTTFRLPLHYSLGYAERYDMPAEWILSRLKGVLKRTANGLLAKENGVDLAIARAAATNRSGEMAFVVNDQMGIVDANVDAGKALERRNVVSDRQGKLTFVERKLADAIRAAVRSIAASAASEVTSVTAQVESGWWVFYFSLVAGSRANPLVSTRPLILIQARNIADAPSQKPITEFARMFMLTPAEENFCRYLMAGTSVKDIACATGVTFETARFRLRAIFQKTNVHRQGELVSLLHRFVGH